MSEFNWRNPDYDAEFLKRAEFIKRIREPGFDIAALKQHFTDNPVDFVTSFGCTFDPRNAEIGLPTVIPFIPFKRQADFIDWTVARWKNREDGLAEKSRDMGVSWLCVAIAVWMWLYHPGVVVGFGSRKEEYVDKIGDPKSLFWKIRQFIALLPRELRPAKYDESKHAPHMRILNPDNGSAIIGEAGDNIGRGNRTSIYFKDESAFYEHAEAIDAALSQTSNCKIDISTPNGNGNPFYRKRHGGKIPVFTFHWKNDPRKDEAWYQKQRDTLDPIIVAQEIDIDYNASSNDSWINGQLVADAMRLGAADVQAIGNWMIGVDAAHFGDDESVVHMRRGRLNLPQKTYRGLDGPQLAGNIEEQCHNLVKSGGTIGSIIIELDGPGVSCYDTLRKGQFSANVVGVHTGQRMSDDKNYNLKAKLWRLAQEYLSEPPVSLAPCGELKSQLSSVKYAYKDGLLLMQSKKQYKSVFGKSPDRADAFVLSFGAPERPAAKRPAAMPRANTRNAWMGM